MSYIRERNQQRPSIEGFIFMWQLKAAGLCAVGQKDFYLQNNLSKSEVLSFIRNGMPIQEFKQRFEHDAMAQQGIAYWEQYYGRKQ